MKPTPTPPSLPEGSMIKEYRVGRCLGRGSMGEVYEAQHATIGRRVAIKLLRDGADVELNAGRRLLEEARSVNSIRHAGIVEVFDIGLFNDKRPYLVMELLEGMPLSGRIRKGGITAEQALTWLDGILDALDAAHRAGVIHRDLKPSNVFIVGQHDPHRVKLLDFGVARRAGRKEVFTAPSMAVGSIGFMAPEQLQGNASASSDLYAVGCLAFQLFAGRPVFPLKNIPDAAKKHMREPAPLLRSIKADVSAQVEGWVDRLLQKDPRARPPSARAALLDLRAVELEPELTHSRQQTDLVPAFTPPSGRAKAITASSMPTKKQGPIPGQRSAKDLKTVESREPGTDKNKTLFDT